MAQNPYGSQYRPRTFNRSSWEQAAPHLDEALRIAFDYIYLPKPAAPPPPQPSLALAVPQLQQLGAGGGGGSSSTLYGSVTQIATPVVANDVTAAWGQILAPNGVTVTGAYANVEAAPSGGAFQADWLVDVSGTGGSFVTIFSSTKLQISSGLLKGSQANLAITSLPFGTLVRLDILATFGARGLNVAWVGSSA